MRAIIWSLCFILAFFSFSANTMSEEKKDPYAFVISGGVSLGAYEAGVNWALLKALKEERESLKAVTGASAGGINALITAVSWCAANSPDTDNAGYLSDTVDDNLFKTIWTGIDMSELFPRDGKNYNTGDGLLSRKSIDDKIQLLANTIDPERGVRFRENCEVPIGLVATRAKARDIRFPDFVNGKIKVMNDRFAIPVILSVEKNSGHLKFVNRVSSLRHGKNDNVIFLSGQGNKPCSEIDGSHVSPDRVFQAIKATSAFPIAFGQQEISYCIYNGTVQDNDSGDICSKGRCSYKEDKRYFVDGGVFDNIPLGLMVQLLKAGGHGQGEYFFMDPDSRRGMANDEIIDDGVEKQPYTLYDQLSFVKGVYTTARQYELYKALKKPGANSFSPNVIDRYPPLTGAYMANFGAFLDKSFRLYDYYAGVYDAVFYLASAYKGKYQDAPREKRICHWYGKLGIGDNPTASWVFNKLLLHEDKRLAQAIRSLGASRKTCPSIGKLDGAIDSGVDYNVKIIANSIMPDNSNKEPEFDKFINSLNSDKEFKKDAGSSLVEVMDNSNWGNQYTLRASKRVLQMQKQGQGKQPKVVKSAFGFVGLLSEKSIRNEERGWGFRQAFKTESIWRYFAPYEISTNLNGRGWAFSYEMTYRRTNFWNFNLRITPYGYEGLKEDRFHYGQADLFYNLDLKNVPVVRKAYPFISSVGAGPSVTRGYNGDKAGTYTGAAMYIGFFGDFVRLTYGDRDVTMYRQDEFSHADDHFIYLGITDVFGFMRWLM